MKKRTTTKRKSKSNFLRKHKMSLKEKELMAATILVFFVFAFLLAIINTSQNSNISITGKATYTRFLDENTGEPRWKDSQGTIYDYDPSYGQPYEPGEKSFIRDLFSQFGGERLDINIGKYVIWFTVFFFVFGALSIVKFPPMQRGGGFIRAMLSLGLSFLMSAYLVPENIYTIIMSLETVSMMLTTLPFIAILIGTGALLGVESAEKLAKMNVGKIIAVRALWITWLGFLVFRIIRAWAEKGFAFLFRGGGIVLLFILAPSVLIVIFFNSFQRWIINISKKVIKMRADVLGTAEGSQQGRKKHTSSFHTPLYNPQPR